MAAISQPVNDATVQVFGRDFHRYSVQHEVYCIPVDEKEEQRLAMLHDVLHDFFDQRLVMPQDFRPRDVLDCGCGKGYWADAVVEEFDCEVFGVDIYLAGGNISYLKKRWNLNAPFVRDQATLTADQYDLVNARFVSDGMLMQRWPPFVRDLYERVRPNGWVQMGELYMNVQSDSGRIDEAPSLSRWWQLYSQGLEMQGKDPRVGTTVMSRSWKNLTELLENAGFVDIHTERLRLPIGGWQDDPRSKTIGVSYSEVAAKTLEAVGLWPCCHNHGMDMSAFVALIEGCKREIVRTELKLYMPLYVVWGRRPHPDQASTTSPGPVTAQMSPVPPVTWS